MGPGQVEIPPFFTKHSERCRFFKVGENRKADWINTKIYGKKCAGTNVTLTDQSGQKYYITFNTKEDAQNFTANIHFR